MVRASRRPAVRRTPPPIPPRAVIATSTVATVVSWSIVAVVLWPVYRDASYLVLAVVAIASGVALALAGVLLRWPAVGMLVAAAATMLVVGVPLAVPDRTVYGVLPEPGGLVDLIAGIALGWRQLITIDLPVGAYQALLVPALVLLLVGPLATLALSLRTRRGELGALVPLLGFLLAIALGPETVALPISTAIALATTLLLWQAAWRRHRRAAAVGEAGRGDAGRSGVRAIATATGLLLVAGGAGAALVAEAKAKGVPITCDVGIYHLHLCDRDIADFDPQCNLVPPLRDPTDRALLRKAVADGTIDAICSDHTPLDDDAKQVPFGEAAPGATGLELLLPLVLKWAGEAKIEPHRALLPVTVGAARVLGIAGGTLACGAAADICLFDADRPWIVQPSALASQGKNTPYLGLELVGRVARTVVGGRTVFPA